MAGRREGQSGSAKLTQTQERTTVSPAQVERAVDAIQYLSTIGRSTTNGDGTTLQRAAVGVMVPVTVVLLWVEWNRDQVLKCVCVR